MNKLWSIVIIKHFYPFLFIKIKTEYCQMANALFNYITPYFAKISTQNHINDLKFIMRNLKDRKQ